MVHELLLLRHAKSDWSVSVSDFSRPLNKRGRKAAKAVGIWLREQNILPDMIISSPAVRALTTAERVCKQLDIAKSSIITDPRIYEAEASTLLSILKTARQSHRLLLVGHNPGLEVLLSQLVPQVIPLSENGKCFPTASLAQLSFDGDWTELSKGAAKLVTLFRPESVSEQ